MAKSEPLRSREDIEKIKNYFIRNERWRDLALFTLGLNTALRISDLLSLRWGNVYNYDKSCFYRYITITEKKTQKLNKIALNQNVIDVLGNLKMNLQPSHEDYIIKSRVGENKPIHRNRAYSIIRKAAEDNGIEGVICCHSLRKTFGYQAWKNGVSPAIIMDIYNHSSMKTTQIYLSINQDDRDQVFTDLLL